VCFALSPSLFISDLLSYACYRPSPRTATRCCALRRMASASSTSCAPSTGMTNNATHRLASVFFCRSSYVCLSYSFVPLITSLPFRVCSYSPSLPSSRPFVDSYWTTCFTLLSLRTSSSGLPEPLLVERVQWVAEKFYFDGILVSAQIPLSLSALLSGLHTDLGALVAAPVA
jgi:hypothetical protein